MDTNKNFFDSERPVRLKLSHFDYHLPPDYIAQYPLEKRDESRLMVLDRATRQISHRIFKRKLGIIWNPATVWS